MPLPDVFGRRRLERRLEQVLQEVRSVGKVAEEAAVGAQVTVKALERRDAESRKGTGPRARLVSRLTAAFILIGISITVAAVAAFS
jgi:hypothetical protein